MPINYVVQADVVDIRTDSPLATDCFFVDTNVWCWMTYTRASLGKNPPKPQKVVDYPAYIGSAIAGKARLLRCGLSLAELAHVIEKNEREIYSQATGFNDRLTKEFRHNHPVERSRVVAEIETAWGLVKNMSAPTDILVGATTTDAALVRFQSQAVDGYDLFLLEAITRAGVVQVITDDGDYCTVPGICVFTSNLAVLARASAQGKLIVRPPPPPPPAPTPRVSP